MNRSVLGLALTLLAAPAAYAGVYSVTTLTDPLASAGANRGTTAIGIAGNTVVGYYSTPVAGQPFATYLHGFTCTNGAYTTIDVPGATAGTTVALGVSGNTIVGQFQNATGAHGFIDNGGVFTTIDAPATWYFGSPATYPYGIDGNNIVGFYQNGGFISVNGAFHKLDCPSATPRNTYPLHIVGSTVIGHFTSATGEHGFIATPTDATFDNWSWTTIDDPLATAGTWAFGMNDSGTVAGYYKDAAGAHGFLRTGGTYTSYDLPVATRDGTYLYGISGDTLVGSYAATDGTIHGFTATPVPEPCTLGLFAVASLAMLACRQRRQLTVNQ